MAKRRWKRILLIATIVVLVLMILLPPINSAWCAHVTPAGFSEDGMSGAFSSDRYSFVSRRLFVKLPKQELSCGEPCEVEAIVYYNLWSLYRPGQILRTHLTATVFDNQIVGGNLSAPARSSGEPLIQYLGIPGTITVGSYRASDPADFGHFVIGSQ